MNLTTQTCPCCGNSLLRHVRHSRVYWFCTSCWQEVPLFAVGQTSLSEAVTGRKEAVKVS